MRRFLSCLAAACLLAAQASAEPCARPEDRAAFDVVGLKSQLMVTAITCGAEASYNAFVLRFRRDLAGEERVLERYFSRGYGARATREHDDYITSLANAQSQSGLKWGTLFCGQNVGLFDEVMAVKRGTELATLAAARLLAQPIALTECAFAARRPTRVAAAEPVRRPK